MFKGVKTMAVNYYTKEGFQKLQDELNELKTRGRADMASKLPKLGIRVI